MKTLNDSLREEFIEVLEDEKFKTVIEFKKLDLELIQGAFEILLDNKNQNLTEDHLNDGRQQFQNYLVNHFKGKL